MRVTHPRIQPLEKDQWNEEAAALLTPIAERGRVLNIFKTLANHSALARRWMVFANHILGKSTLPEKERELVILRIGYLCQAGYEWGQHVEIARRAGMTDEEILCSDPICAICAEIRDLTLFGLLFMLSLESDYERRDHQHPASDERSDGSGYIANVDNLARAAGAG